MTTYEKCKEHIEPRCIFMEIENRENGKGKCTEYNFRPLVCRIFGVAGRHDKNNKIIFSTCSTLKEIHPEKNENLNSQTFSNNEVPFIELAKSRLETLDPAFSEKEYPINVALAMMLEKVMMSASFSD